MAVAILVATALLVAVFGIGYMLGLRNAGAGVSDNGVRIDNVRNELSTAEERQREITSGLESAVQRSDTAEERAVRIEERAVKSESVVRDSGVLIDECQQIKMAAFNEAQELRISAKNDSIRMKEDSQTYAQQLLNNLEQDLNKLYQVVINGQQRLQEMRAADANQQREREINAEQAIER